MPASVLALFAVHISDGVLEWPWLLGGFAVAGLLAGFGAWRIRDEEIPQVAVMTAAFFVASLVHVRVPPTSVHLLFNGLVGIVLSRRAALAIPVGLFLQAALIGHGGFTTLGVNSCVMVVPALLAWQLFTGLQRVPWVKTSFFRGGLITTSIWLWTLCLIYGLVLLAAQTKLSALLVRILQTLPALNHQETSMPVSPMQWADAITFHPLVLALACVPAVCAALLERRLNHAPEFAIGLLVGQVVVLVTAFLNCLVLAWGGQENWETLAQLVFVAHLPIAVVEGIVLGFTVGFLARVKPEMLCSMLPEKERCTIDTLP